VFPRNVEEGGFICQDVSGWAY